MKKLIIAMMALGTVAAQAKTADEIRIYINPGHGSWTANDRPNQIIGHAPYTAAGTDTTSFFESNTNLRKGFGLLEKLRAYGLKYDASLNQTGERHQIGAARDMSNNIVMSHVKCGHYFDNNRTSSQWIAFYGKDSLPEEFYWYNRGLTDICYEVEANHFDMFISIHSNAATEGTTTNFPLFLYRGYDTPTEADGCTLDHQTTSRAMADACWGYAFENPHMQWTSYSMNQKNLRGDCNFYGNPTKGGANGAYLGYLGVLKHGTPGFLVEGYFHTYQPARHRAMNWDVDYMEGEAYAHGVADYFGLQKESTGDIYGIVRDANERFVDALYKPNTATDDRFKPLNGVTAVLCKDGVEVARYTTDNNYNGAFIFKNIKPGQYTITFESADYKAGDPVAVEVKAAKVTYPSVQLVSKSWVAPTVSYVNYPDPMAENTAVMPAAEYAMAAEYTDEPIAELEGKLVQRTIAHNGMLYILAYDKAVTYGANVPVADQAVPTILVYDPATKAVVANVSTEGTAGSFAAIGDIQVSADGVLLASNGTKTQYSDAQIEAGDQGRGTFNIYKWAVDEKGLPTGNPEVFVSTQNTGLWYRAYLSRFAYSGTVDNGNILIVAPSVTAPNHAVRSITIGVIDGVAAANTDFKCDVNPLLGQAAGDVNVFVSPLNDKEGLMIDSKLGVSSWSFATPFNNDAVGNEVLAGIDGRAGIFKYAGASYLVSPANADGRNTGVRLVNITKGVDHATATDVLLSAPVAEVEAAATAAAGEVVVTRDKLTEAVNGGWINLYLLRAGKLTKLTTQGVQQPQGRNEFAYGMAMEEGDLAYSITFNMTGDAPEASIVLTPEVGEAVTVPVGAVVKGENTVTVDKSLLADNMTYDCEIVTVSKPIAQAGVAYADPSGLTTRGSLVTMSDPAYASFGYVVVGHGKNAGVDIYDPAGEKVATRIFANHKVLGGVTTNQSNPIRGGELDGKAVFGTWGDTGYGAVVIDPLDVDAEPFTLFAGTKQGGGHFLYDGVNLGGGTSGITFLKDAAGEQYMLSFSEDHEGLNGSGATENTLVKQHLSGPWQITEAPVVLGYKGLLSNTNVDLVAYGDGVFAAQVRGSGNNQAGTPCFVYIADVLGDHDVTLNSADDALIPYIDDSTSGIAVTKDGKTLAVSAGSKIAVFDLEWNGNTPVPTHRYTFPVATNSWATLRFDAGGNLHAYQREDGYRVYTLPSAAPTATVKAPFQLKAATGVETIGAEEAVAGNAVYFNLQGVQVSAGSLVPGVYVRVSGSKATKVLVK